MAKTRWRDYRTSSGRSPVNELLEEIAERSEGDAASIAGAMKDVSERGLRAARHLRREIYEVRADGDKVAYRVLFAQEGKKGRVLLSLHAFVKKTRKTPPEAIELAEKRLSDWRRRGAEKRKRGRGPPDS